MSEFTISTATRSAVKAYNNGIPRKSKHGHALIGRQTITYNKWRAMRWRCNLKNKINKEDYCDLGITICDRWSNFALFLEDMGECPCGLELDRINNSLGYFKENCRWAPRVVNQRNRRKSVNLTIDGTTRPACEWSAILGISYPTIIWRHKQGWPAERILAAPKPRRNYELAKTS